MSVALDVDISQLVATIDGLDQPATAVLIDDTLWPVADSIPVARLPRPGERTVWTFTPRRRITLHDALVVVLYAFDGEWWRSQELIRLTLSPADGDQLEITVVWH